MAFSKTGARAAIVSVAAGALVLTGATSAFAGDNSPVSISKDKGARGNFVHSGDTFVLTDMRSDGKAAVLDVRVESGGWGVDLTYWNTKGAGKTRKAVNNLTEGNKVLTRACTGNAKTKKYGNCGPWTQGKA
ncbi:hypothetical protein [Streptomyces iconiensis]|uniref:Secreted protein n=1 Tax=Streptomyces iconiensis TaxID=1384038 RepID=A0ABT6ZS27_9ACTN|nr:hypothetical protein [Streptomyces iconiensis]MDJ1131667.1 hypothetical protein [Streptomyces iconiensis]